MVASCGRPDEPAADDPQQKIRHMRLGKLSRRRLAGLGVLPLLAAGVMVLGVPSDAAEPTGSATVGSRAPLVTAAPDIAARPVVAESIETVLGHDAPTRMRPAPSILPQQQAGLNNDQVRWTPEVIFNDGVESTRFEVRLTSNFKDAFITTAGLLDRDAVLPPETAFFASDLIRLFDDGSNGDRVAGDQIYSRSGITASGALQHDGGTHQTLRNNLFFTFNDGSVLARSMEVGVSVVDVSQRGRVTVTALGGGRFATSHALFVVDDGTLLRGYPAINATPATDICLACEALITQFGDIFDFVIIGTAELTDFEGRDESVLAFFSQRRNDVQGIGKGLFNSNGGPKPRLGGGVINTFSADRLRGIVFNNQVDGGPLPHELMHNWAFQLGGFLPFLDGTRHYVNNSDIAGMMDVGNMPLLPSLVFAADAPYATPGDLVANGDGTYRLVPRLGPNHAEFSPIALYVAGFLPPSQVPDMNVFSSINQNDEDRVLVTVSSTTSIDAVLAANGARSPSSAGSAKDFSVGAIVIKDRPFSEAEFTYLTLMLRYFESDRAYDGFGPSPWRAATRGVSTLTTALPGFAEAAPALGDAIAAPLANGWTLIGATEDQAVQSALGSITGAVGPIFTWAPNRQEFRAFNPALPPQLNTLDRFLRGEGVWIFSQGGGGWTQRPFTEARSVFLLSGFNLVTWSGASGTPVAEAIAGLGDAFEVLFTWDADAQTFRSHNAAVPAAFNTAASLARGEGVWIRVNRAASWEQPAP